MVRPNRADQSFRILHINYRGAEDIYLCVRPGPCHQIHWMRSNVEILSHRFGFSLVTNSSLIHFRHWRFIRVDTWHWIQFLFKVDWTLTELNRITCNISMLKCRFQPVVFPFKFNSEGNSFNLQPKSMNNLEIHSYLHLIEWCRTLQAHILFVFYHLKSHSQFNDSLSIEMCLNFIDITRDISMSFN